MRITENVHAIRHTFSIPISPSVSVERFVYSYLIIGDGLTLVDCGIAASKREIYDEIKEVGCGPDDIKRLILTHAHPDHIGCAMSINQDSGCKIEAHPAARAWIEDIELQERERPVPGFKSLVEGPVKVDAELSEGKIDIAGVNAYCIWTPGHSPDSTSLHLSDEGVIISGDAIPVMGDLPIFTDAAESMVSIERLRAIEDIEYLLSSWHPPLRGEFAQKAFDEGMAWIGKIRDAARSEDPKDPMIFAGKVVDRLGLPPAAKNPLVAQSIMAAAKLG